MITQGEKLKQWQVITTSYELGHYTEAYKQFSEFVDSCVLNSKDAAKGESK